jgi:hypothetical protein
MPQEMGLFPVILEDSGRRSIVPNFVSQLLVKEFSGAEDMRLDSANGEIKQVCDLLVALFLDMTHLDDPSIPFR